MCTEIEELLYEMTNAIDQMCVLPHSHTESSIKTIAIDETQWELKKKKNRKKTPPKKDPPKKRVVTQQKQWKQHIGEEDVCIEQTNVLRLDSQLAPNAHKQRILYGEIRRKIDGYRRQDIEKKKYDPIHFVDFDHVVSMLSQSSLQCFYCQESVKLFYDISRDPKQWTLERIQNEYGHNKTNVQISCLSCNIRRRTMYHEKYQFTKQMRLSKMMNT